MFISKGSYRYGESKNAFFYLVQKPHLPVQDGKLPRLMQASIGPRMEICGNPGLPFAMVSCLYQSSVYIKSQLKVWRVQKYIPVVCANTALTSTGRQTTPSHVSQYRAENRNLRKSGSTFRHGTMSAPKQSLHQQEPTGMENPKIHSCSRFRNCTYMCGTENYPVSCKPV